MSCDSSPLPLAENNGYRKWPWELKSQVVENNPFLEIQIGEKEIS